MKKQKERTMPSRKIRSKAFTLIELLVVIAIIALLLSILSPSLRKAKMQAKTIVCTVNCRSLSTAWTVYALDYNGLIVSSNTGYSDYYNHLAKDPLLCPNPWVDWAGYPSESSDDEAEQILAIEQGALYPYVEAAKAYRCPTSKEYELRSYSIPDFFGNKRISGHETVAYQDVLYKMGQITMPSERIIFLDEGYISYGGFTIYYYEAKWWDWPPTRHDDGITIGYADGHSGFVKWKDKRTIELSRGESTTLSQPGNEDIFMIQRGIFGKLGYSP